MVALLFFATGALSLQATTSFYVDPDYTGGSSDGSAARPWTALSSGTWTTLNSALSSDAVTVYFSALKANGTTQQSQGWFLEARRTNPSTNRLTLDGYTYYNANTTTPSWRANPNGNITAAYTNNQVLKLSNSSQALGWARSSGNDFVSNGGSTYCCIRSHIASSDNAPGTGPNWRRFWDQHGSGGSAWTSGTGYACYAKQDNVTLRGFECSGSGSRVGFSGDNFLIECVWTHDLTVGASVTLLYTSYPDGPSAQVTGAPSTNITIRNIRVENGNGEGLYLGALNPDSPEAFQCALGNQYDQVYVTNFFISGAGTTGGQGDGIDCKNGITHLRISDGEIGNGQNTMGGIICPQTFTDADQGLLIERVYIHDITSGTDNRNAIYMSSSVNSVCFKGYNGITVRNCIISSTSFGIVCGAASTLKNIKLYNNTIYNVTGPGIDADSSDGIFEVKNNLLLSNNGGGSQVRFSGSNFDSRNNAYNNTWSGANTNGVSTASTSDLSNVAGGNFTLLSGKPEVDAGVTLSSFGDDFTKRSRPQGSAWDIGAYEYPSGGGTPPNNPPVVSAGPDQIITLPVNSTTLTGTASDPDGLPVTTAWSAVTGPGAVTFSAAKSLTTTATFTTAGSYTLRLTASDGSLTAADDMVVTVNAPSAPGADIVVQATAATVTAPFTITNGVVSQSIETGTTNGGRLVFNFTVSTNGDYCLSAHVNAPNDAANSFFVNIDADPQDPFMVWDIPFTSGFEDRVVSWRGNGTFNNPQLPSKTFTLTKGSHQVIILGREANTQLDRITIIKAPAPPTGLRIVSPP